MTQLAKVIVLDDLALFVPVIGCNWGIPLDESNLMAAVRYVELNPVQAGMVTNAWEYPWSTPASMQARQNPIRW
jgi:hypothetical protein